MRFIVLLPTTIAAPLPHKFDPDWLVPPVTMPVAYPILVIDLTGAALQDPFTSGSLGHLPPGAICEAIEANLLGLLSEEDLPPDREDTDDVLAPAASIPVVDGEASRGVGDRR